MTTRDSRRNPSSINSSHWTRSRERIQGYPAIRNRITGELTLAGKYGELYQFSDTEYRALVISARVANRLCRYLGCPAVYGQEDEAILKVSFGQFQEVARILKIYKSRKLAMKAANSFGQTPPCFESLTSNKSILTKGTTPTTLGNLKSNSDRDSSNFAQAEPRSKAKLEGSSHE